MKHFAHDVITLYHISVTGSVTNYEISDKFHTRHTLCQVVFKADEARSYMHCKRIKATKNGPAAELRRCQTAQDT